MAPIRTERGFDRLVNFTDAAVAISITLLVLPLVEIGSDITHESLGALLHDHWPNILAFVISFAVIGNLWLVHHRLFELITAYDSGLARLNLFWLAAITVLPFSTNILANAVGGLSGVYALYIGNVVVASGATVLIRFYLSRHHQLLREGCENAVNLAASLIPTGILLICLVLAIFVPTIGPFWLLLMFAGNPIERALLRHKQPSVSDSP